MPNAVAKKIGRLQIEKDRLQKTFDFAKSIFDDESLTLRWLCSSKEWLGGKKPIEVMHTRKGYRRVRRHIILIAGGMFLK